MMRIGTYSLLAALALLTAATLPAQTTDESQTLGTVPATVEQSTTPETSTPEAGVVQAPAEPPATTESESIEGPGIHIERETPASEPAAETAGAAAELPQTASPLALLALLGFGSTGAALGVRIARNRR